MSLDAHSIHTYARLIIDKAMTSYVEYWGISGSGTESNRRIGQVVSNLRNKSKAAAAIR